jgi:carbonic anhydrase
VLELVWRRDPSSVDPRVQPATAAEAASLLVEGNGAFAAAIDRHARGEDVRLVTPISASDIGLAPTAGEAPRHEPFAAVVGCADARVPVELVLGQQINGIFVVRVAGNVLGAECLGSLEYAVENLPVLRLLVVLGHTRCGALGAAVDAYLDAERYLGTAGEPSLRAVVDALTGAVRIAAEALAAEVGPRWREHRAALVDTAATINAAIAATALRHAFRDRTGPSLDVVFGVYDLGSRVVGLPGPAADWAAGLAAPPAGAGELAELGGRAARLALHAA